MNLMEERAYLPAILARQPVFDKAKRVRGYELLFRKTSHSTQADYADEDLASMRVAADASVCLGGELSKSPCVMVNFSAKAVLEQAPYALPPGQTVVELSGDADPEPPLLDALARLKKDGYRFCLDGFSPSKEPNAFLQLADFVKIDVLSHGRQELERAVRMAEPFGAKIVAKRVETGKLYDMAVSLGFSWFQGFFFQKPEIVPGRKLPSNQSTRLKLFQLIEQEDVPLDRLAEVIQADVSISYRLLTLLNSAAFGLPTKIRSIHRAIIMLGLKQLRNWLRVVILTDMAPKGKTRELCVSSVMRGKFLENVALAHDRPGETADALFLLGLFSLLEALLDMPMAEIVEALPLYDPIKEALRGEDNEYGRWLSLAIRFEDADWARLDETIAALGLDPARIAAAYFEALDWTRSFFINNV